MAETQLGALQTRRGQGMLLQAGVFVVLGLMSLTFLLPMLWMLSTSLKPIEETMKMPPVFLPIPFPCALNLEETSTNEKVLPLSFERKMTVLPLLK